MSSKEIKIDIVSDIACPWCYIGKKNLEKALNATSNEFNFNVNFLPYQLNPEIPTKGENFEQYFTKKFGSIEYAEQIFDRVNVAGAKSNIKFNFNKIEVIPNSLKLHILIEKCKNEHFITELIDDLFNAYLVHPIDLTQDSNLVKIMEKYGWNEQQTQECLNNSSLQIVVQNKIKESQNLGISGVPFLIINNKYGISGAQSSETFIDAFRNISIKEQNESNSCNIDQSNC